jgi:ribosomal protein S18 acetylase RimI-like enzyme
MNMDIFSVPEYTMRLVPMKNGAGYRIVHLDRTLGKLYYAVDRDTFIINYIAISKPYQGKGWGKKVLKKILKKDYRCFRTTTIAKSNVASRNLFKSAGFTEKSSGKQLYATYYRT